MRRDLVNKSGSLAGTSDLTVFAPIKPGLVPSLDAMTYKTRVKRVLRSLHLGRTGAHESELVRLLSDSVERVGRIHSVSIAVIEGQSQAPDQVMLTVTFDGAWEAYVRVIWQKVARLLDLIFCHTEGYVIGWENSYEAWGRWLRDAQAETAFLYATPGVTVDDKRYLQMHERLHRRGKAADPAVDLDLAITRLRIPSAEQIAAQGIFGQDDQAGIDPTNAGFGVPLTIVEAAQPSFRHGVRSLVGLYRLADVFVPGTPDGDILHRAAQELLPEFLRMLRDGNTYQLGISRALPRFEEALRWLEAEPPLPRVRMAPPLPARQPLPAPANVQGGIVEAYDHIDHGGLLLLGFDTPAALGNFLAALDVTRASDVLTAGTVTTNISFTAQGLRMAGLPEDLVRAFPAEFVQGMESRAGLLGDLRINHPRRWRLPPQNWALGIAAPDLGDVDSDKEKAARVDLAAVHAVLHLQLWPAASMSVPDARQRLLDEMKRWVAADAGVKPLSLQWLHRLRDPGGSGKVVEHFGFQDGGSDPVLDAAQAGRRFSNQVHLGEILCGYANRADHGGGDGDGDSTDSPLQREAKALLHDGSFLVLRKLRQDTVALDAALANAVDKPIGPALPRATLMAKMMGRWPNDAAKADAGKPLARVVPGAIANDFHFDGDPQGATCPFHAHIRRANPRETQPESGSRPPRIVRRGMSYGPRHDPTDAASAAVERGLVFMAYNASIGEQFEVVQRWLMGGNSSGSTSNQSDPFLGLAEPGRRRYFNFEEGGQTVRLPLDGSDDLGEPPRPFVRLEWGAYLFAPSTTALNALKARAQAAPRTAIGWDASAGSMQIAGLRALEATQGELAAAMAWKAALEDPDAATDFSTASIWAAIREHHGGALRTPFGVLVASKGLVEQVLRDADHRLTATGYLPRMRRSFGGIYLGLDAGQADGAYERESLACNEAIMTLDTQKAFDRARAATLGEIDKRRQEALGHAMADGEPRWELTLDARELVTPLLADLCEEWFGLSTAGDLLQRSAFRWDWRPGDAPSYPGHFLAPSRYFFQPRPSREVENYGAAHGVALLGAMTAFLHRHGADIEAKVTRAVLDSALGKADPAFAPRTVVGAIMGFVPTVDGNLRRILNEWLRDGTLWALRARFAGQASANLGEASKRLLPALGAAMQLRTAPELLWRTATVAHTLGDAGPHQVEVRPGDIVVAALISATQQSLEQGDADLSHAFGGDRWASGPRPTHACPGAPAAMAALLGFFSALVETPEPLRAGPGPLTLSLDGPVDPVAVAAVTAFRFHLRNAQFEPAEAKTYRTERPTPIVLVGDSWMSVWWQPSFIGALRDEGYATVKHFSSLGRRLAEMARADHLAEVVAYLRELDPADPQGPQAIFLGGGGNDVVYPSSQPMRTPLFDMLHQSPASGDDPLIEAKVAAFIDETLFGHYKTLIDAIKAATPLPIFVHAYDHPIPDGRAEPPEQPWLKPVFEARKISDDLALRTDVMKRLITRLDTMVARVASANPDRVHHVSLCGTLAKDPRYATTPELLWRNELHPTLAGFALLARVVSQHLQALGIGAR